MKKTYDLIVGTAEFFRQLLGYVFIYLVSLAAMAKMFKFLSFLLPFKALIVAANTEFKLQISHRIITNTELAIGLVCSSILSYVAYMYQSNKLENSIEVSLLTALSSHSSNSIYRGVVIKNVLRDLVTSIEFYASIMIVLSLLVAMSIVLPLTLLLNILLFLLFLFLMKKLFFNGASDSKSQVFSGKFLERYGYFSQVIVLIGIGAWIIAEPKGQYLAAIFGFISTRQLWVNINDAAKLIERKKNSAWPRYIEPDHVSIEVSRIQFPYLSSKLGYAWLSKAISAGLGTEVLDLKSQWRDLNSRFVHSFFAKARAGSEIRNFILQIYSNKNSRLANSEVTLSMHRYTKGSPLVFLSDTSIDGYRMIIYEHQELEQVEKLAYFDAMNNLLVEMWSQIYPANELIVEEPTNLDARAIEQLLTVAASEMDRKDVQSVISLLDKIKYQLSTIPIALNDIDMSSRSVLSTSDGTIILGPTGRANQRPIGSFLWRIKHNYMVDLDYVCHKLNELRPDCRQLSPSDLLLAKHVYGLEKNLENGFFSSALYEVQQIASIYQKNDLSVKTSVA